MTLVDVVLAIAFTGMAIAASAAAISAASNSRSATVERSLAAEIANEVIQEAEAFGCGLPDPYLGVTAAERATRCTFGNQSRGGYSFTVVFASDWHLLDPVPAGYMTSLDDECERPAAYAKGTASTPPDTTNDPPAEGVPTVLERTVTVTADGTPSRAVELTSLQAVLPHLAADGWTCS